MKALLWFLAGVLAAGALAFTRTAPARWEYHAFIGGNINKDLPRLDSLGAEGWELVTVEPCTGCGIADVSTLYLRRALP